MIKKTPLEEYMKTKKKSGLPAITLRDGDELAAVFLIKDEPIVIFTYNGYGIHFNSDEVGPTSRATMGVKGINLKEGDYVATALPVRDMNDSIALFSEKGIGKRIPIFEKQKRGGRGSLCYNVCISSGRLEGASMVNDTDKLLVVGDKKSICIEATELPNLAKLSIGNQVLKDSRFVSVSKI
jgi:DNA gyrase/topoisomerase IV subunit A